MSKPTNPYGDMPDVETPLPESPMPLELDSDAKSFAMLVHLLAIFTGFIGPLIIWLVKKDEYPFVDDQGKEALNFQITVTLATLVSCVLVLVCIGYFLLFAIMIIDLVFCIMATIAANRGETYRYPINIRFIN